MRYLILVLIVLSTPSMAGTLSESEVSQLNILAPSFNSSIDNVTIQNTKSDSCEVNSAKAILRFKKYGMKEMEELFDQFSVDDYKERNKGNYNLWSPGKITQLTGELERKYTNVSDKRLYMLIMFCETKDKNLWVNTESGRLSVARFFRSAFLASVLDNTVHDAVELSNAIDMETQKRAGFE